MRVLVITCALLAACAAACGQTGGPADDKRPSPQPVGGSSNATGGNATGGSGPTKPGEMPKPVCTATGPSPVPTPLSALSNFEINRSVRALLGDTTPSDESHWLVEDEHGSPFSSLTQDPLPQPTHELAHDLAVHLSTDPAAIQAFGHCDPLTSGDDTCATAFIEAFVARAFRRPLTNEDRDDMKGVFAEGKRLDGDFKGGIRAVVEVALQSPEFLLMVETGAGENADGLVELTGSESATRLAYFLTGSPPDTELAAVASQGTLSADALEEQARRLLGSPASRELVRHFYDGMLRLPAAAAANDAFGYTSQIAALAQEESERFVEDVTFDGTGTFRALLTEPSTWVNEPLAQFYGLPGVTGADFRKVALDPTRRAGVLTQAAFLRVHAHENSTNPVARGIAVLREVLCGEILPPPPDIDLTVPEPIVGPATMRQRLTAATQPTQCQLCHAEFNPLGFAFEHYDAVGKWQDTDNGFPIDSSGVLTKTDAAGTFADAIDLLKRVADSDDAKSCFVEHWLAQAYRRPAEPGDACAIEQVSQAFADSDGNLVELMVTLATSDSFRYRLKPALTP